jgi:hypothetical protein
MQADADHWVVAALPEGSRRCRACVLSMCSRLATSAQRSWQMSIV